MESNEKTGVFNPEQLGALRCPDCGGTGEVRIESENINENFEVEKQTVIAECPRCHGMGLIKAG